ncbi:protein-cysteine N-palmitoyltransferase HHAT-like [Apostichopus japonicus]|uniref:protein-cysteine N-palmitoyltransferase HHAT-like n=1 Tax=Stichopus japonicus TaxID=307972 RepID=UPI003AB3E9BB
MKHKKISRHAVNKTPSRLETIDEEREVSFGDSAKSELYAKLPLLEICTYVGWSMFAWFCVISSLYQSSQKHASALHSSSLLLRGWQLLGDTRQDGADVEWRFWKMTINSQFLLMVLVYVLIMRVVEILIPLKRELAWTILSVSFLTIFYEWQLPAMLVMHTFVSFLASRSRSTRIVWIVSTLQLCSLYVEGANSIITAYFGFPHLEHAKFFTAICIIKLVSFSLECCDEENLPVSPSSENTQDTLFDALSYALYLPFVFAGPCTTYDLFRTQMNKPVEPLNKEMLWGFLSEFIRYTLALLAVEFFLHFLYVPALAHRKDILREESFPTLSAVIVLSLVFFQMKYLILYGFPRAIALLDGFNAPLPPVCVLGLYSFKDMWKYFDRGLHRFLVRYIFIPLGGSRQGVLMNIMSAAVTFLFVFFWHGPQSFVFVWAILNWFGIMLEVLAGKLGRTLYAKDMDAWLSGATYRRLMGLVLVLPNTFIVAANLVYLHGEETLKIQIKNMLFSGHPSQILWIFVSVYCNLQMNLEARRIWGKRYLCTKGYYFRSNPKEKEA